MSDLNAVVITGRLTRDPELRDAGGTSVLDMGIAVNGREKRSGEWQERADFFDVTVWGSQAENCERYLSKGSPVAVSGHLRLEQWEKDGNKRSKVKIVARSVQFLPTGGNDGERSESKQSQSAPV